MATSTTPNQPASPASPSGGASGGGGSGGIKIVNVNFFDIRDRENTARSDVRADWQMLEQRKQKVGPQGEDDLAEYNRLGKLLAVVNGTATKTPQFIDPLFGAARHLLRQDHLGLQPIEVEHGGFTPASSAKLTFPKLANADEATRDREVARIGLVIGLLQLWKAPLPRLIADSAGEVKADDTGPNYGEFGEQLVKAMARVSTRIDLAVRILKTMSDAVNVAGDAREPEISSLEYAQVFEKLVERNISAKDPNLKPQVEESFGRVQDIGADKPMHEFEINLPDLEATTEFEVVGDHCRLMGSFIFASAFEELKAFQVVDKLVEMSQRGEIPLIRGPAGTQLYSYWREAPNRMSEVERQNFYAMTLGLPTGQPGVSVNSDFQDLWLRFVSSVSSLVRESRVDRLIRSSLPVAINQQQVKKAARDLAVNMSSRGYGMIFYAAADLQKQINDMIALLRDPELRAAFGARDMWGVIDQIAQTELGGARNSSKYRMLATSGAIITNWIANHTDRLRDPTAPMVELRDVENPPARASGQTPVSKPTDYDLVNACEMWLADSAMGEDRVEQMSQPRESPQVTSRPIQIPSIARDLLEGTGLGLGMGFDPGLSRANGRANGHGSYAGY